MTFELQKANVWKRISAFLFDIILLVTLAVGFAYLTSQIIGYDAKEAELEALYARYEEEYGIKFDLSEEEYAALSEEELALYETVSQTLMQDAEAQRLYQLVMYMTLIIISVGFLLAYVLLEFAVPLLLKEGRTLGKKIFGIALMQQNAVRVSHLALFARTILGKFALETMVPVALVLMLIFWNGGPIVIAVLAALLLTEAGLFLLTKKHTALHDIIAYTVAVDMQTQMIFDSESARDAYWNRKKEEQEAYDAAHPEY